MGEHVIVTIRTDDGAFEADMELPHKTPVSEFEQPLIAALKSAAAHRFASMRHLNIRCGNEMIDLSQSLEENGVWDGAILVLVD